MQKLKKILKDIERIIDTLIWPALIALLGIIIIEIWFHNFAEHYHAEIYAIDNLIIILFIIDLIYKWFATRKIGPFLKHYWPDILAVFPFFLIFRIFEGVKVLFGPALEVGETTQKIVHESLEIEKEGARIAKEVEAGLKEGSKIEKVAKEVKLTRTTRFQRFIRPILRTPRFLKAAEFFRKPE